MTFKKSSSANTIATANKAIAKAKEIGVNHLVIASNTGASIQNFLGKGLALVCVTHQIGFREPGQDEMGEEMRNYLTENGVKILTTTHLFGNVGRAISRKFGGTHPGDIIAHTLRMFGQGTKVALEIAVMALDAGLIPYGKDIISVGGSGSGANTAVLLRPEHSLQIFDSKIREIICRPQDF